MALPSNALVSTDEARAFLGAATGDDPVIERAIARASQLVESYCGRSLARQQTTNTRIRGPRSRVLYVEVAPLDVVEPIAVTLDGTALTVWRSEADGDPESFDVVAARSAERGVFQPDHLYCATGWWCRSSSHPYNVVLSYWGGFALKDTPTPPRTEKLLTVPADLRDAVLLTTRRIFDDEKKTVGEVVAVNTPSGGVTLFDRWIPSRAREVLDMGYRLVRVA